jgi:hypothetical protein
MHSVDGLQWAHHYSEFNDLAFVVTSDDVDAVAVFAFDSGFKFENCGVSVKHFFGVSKFG